MFPDLIAAALRYALILCKYLWKGMLQQHLIDVQLRILHLFTFLFHIGLCTQAPSPECGKNDRNDQNRNPDGYADSDCIFH